MFKNYLNRLFSTLSSERIVRRFSRFASGLFRSQTGTINLSASADSNSFEPFVSAAVVAGWLKTKERTVLHWTREGKLPARRVGKFWRFRASELDHFVTGGKLFASQSAREKLVGFMLTRETYQGGSLAKESRVKGDVWIYRWRETAHDGTTVTERSASVP